MRPSRDRYLVLDIVGGHCQEGVLLGVAKARRPERVAQASNSFETGMNEWLEVEERKPDPPASDRADADVGGEGLENPR